MDEDIQSEKVTQNLILLINSSMYFLEPQKQHCLQCSLLISHTLKYAAIKKLGIKICTRIIIYLHVHFFLSYEMCYFWTPRSLKKRYDTIITGKKYWSLIIIWSISIYKYKWLKPQKMIYLVIKHFEESPSSKPNIIT